MTSIWFPNNKYPPNTKNYLPCFVLGGGRFSIRRKGLYMLHVHEGQLICSVGIIIVATQFTVTCRISSPLTVAGLRYSV